MIKVGQTVVIQGPAGKLEVLRRENESPNAIALIGHPNSSQGGSNSNKVVQTLSKVLNRLGSVCYCPNFRSVGLSEGVYDEGRGELDDLKSVLGFAKSENPELPVILAGFSFGGFVVSHLAQQIDYKYVVLVAPAYEKYNSNVAAVDASKSLLIHGDKDEVVPLESAMRYGAEHQLVINVFGDTGHFFHRRLVWLGDFLERKLQCLKD